MSELDLFGVYLPPLMGYAALAILPWLLARRLLDRAGGYRLVWHRPLFDAARKVILLGRRVAARLNLPGV